MSPQRPLSERDIDTLEELVRVHADWKRMGIDRFPAPMDVGGFNGSHHSQTLRKLCSRGLCVMHKSGRKRDKGSIRYESNEAGIAYLREIGRLPRGMT